MEGSGALPPWGVVGLMQRNFGIWGLGFRVFLGEFWDLGFRVSGFREALGFAASEDQVHLLVKICCC